MGDDWLKFKVGDLVSRISHNHDIVFRIISIDQQNVFLKGVDLRLYADADIDDLTIVNNVFSISNYYISNKERKRVTKESFNWLLPSSLIK